MNSKRLWASLFLFYGGALLAGGTIGYNWHLSRESSRKQDEATQVITDAKAQIERSVMLNDETAKIIDETRQAIQQPPPPPADATYGVKDTDGLWHWSSNYKPRAMPNLVKNGR